MEFQKVVKDLPDLYYGIAGAADMLWMVYNQEFLHDDDDWLELTAFYRDSLVRSVVTRHLRIIGKIPYGPYSITKSMERCITRLTGDVHRGFAGRLLPMSLKFAKQIHQTPTYERRLEFGGLKARLKGERKLADDIVAKLKVITRGILSNT